MKLQNERKKKYKAKQGKMRSEKRNLKKKKTRQIQMWRDGKIYSVVRLVGFSQLLSISLYEKKERKGYNHNSIKCIFASRLE